MTDNPPFLLSMFFMLILMSGVAALFVAVVAGVLTLVRPIKPPDDDPGNGGWNDEPPAPVDPTPTEDEKEEELSCV